MVNFTDHPLKKKKNKRTRYKKGKKKLWFERKLPSTLERAITFTLIITVYIPKSNTVQSVNVGCLWRRLSSPLPF